MENGGSAGVSSTSKGYQMPSFADCLPPVADYIHSIKADSISTQCSEIIDHFSMEVAQVIAPKTVVKVRYFLFYFGYRCTIMNLYYFVS